MRALLERLSGALHGLLAAASLWLVCSSPWLVMVDRLPRQAGVIDLAHVGAGLAVALLLPAYLVHCLAGSRWRQLLPWPGGGMAPVWRDLAGLARGRLPAVEGGGLLALLEGLLLLALLASALSGLGWLAAQGGPAALDWADAHSLCARGFTGLLLLHLAAVSLHLLDFVRS